MTDALTLLLAFAAGTLVAGLFFGGLWLTVNSLDQARWPALTLLFSLLVRLLLACGAFYLIVELGSLLHLALALAGFLMLRLVLVQRIAPDASAAAMSRDRLGPAER